MQFEVPRPLNLPLLASFVLHALLLGTLWWTGLQRAGSHEVNLRPSWSASGVEVGLVPTAPPEPQSPAPASQPESPSPAPTPKAAAEPSPSPRPSPSPSPSPAVLAHSEPSHTEPIARAAPSVTARVAASRPANSGAAHESAPAAPPHSVAGESPSAEPTAATGSLGSLGLPPGVQHFARAFSWALPEGGHRDRAWSELPLGAAGQAVIDVTIDEDGRIVSAEFDPLLPPPPAVKRMIDHAIFLLRPRRFSLDPKTVDVGVERLALEFTLAQEAARGDSDENPLGLASEGHKPPEGDRPGYARFTLNSGRHLEVSITRKARK